MNQQEFMKRLEELLTGISPEEREEALAYYRSYFEDAGIENEQKVIRELESPEGLAESIKAGLVEDGMAEEKAENTQRTYTAVEYTSERGSTPTANDNTALIVVSIIVAVVTAPVWVGILSGIFGGCLGLIGGLCGITIGGIVGGLGCIIGGVSAIVLADVPTGLLLLGGGSLLIAVGILSLLLLVLLCGRFIPWMIRGIISLCRKLFHKEGKEQRA